RYASAGQLNQDVRRFLAGEPILARPTSVVERGVKWARRRPALATLLPVSGLSVMALAVAISAAAFQRGQRNAALASLERAEQAEAEARDAQERATVLAHLARARAYRYSRQVGQRFKALDELGAAARLRPSALLRHEAIACLAQADLRPANNWANNPAEEH